MTDQVGPERGAAPLPGPWIERLSAVSLPTRDMARSVRFYRSLGFRLHRGGEGSPFTTFEVGAGCLNLVAGAPGGGAGPGVRVIFHVSDVDVLYRRALALGLSPEAPPRDAGWGERYFHLPDPDGHQLSFARPLVSGWAPPAPAGEEPAEVSRLLSRLDRELWLVTAEAGGRRGGLIATFVSPASIAPLAPRLHLGLAHRHHTRELVEESGAFALHLLGEEHLDWVFRFGLESGRGRDKLAGLPVRQAATGSPIMEGTLGWADCRVEASLDGGDRTFYLAAALRGRLERDLPPLTLKRLRVMAPPGRIEELARLLEEDGKRDQEAIGRWRAAGSGRWTG